MGRSPRYNELREDFLLLLEGMENILLLVSDGSMEVAPSQLSFVMASICPEQVIPLSLGISSIPAIKALSSLHCLASIVSSNLSMLRV